MLVVTLCGCRDRLFKPWILGELLAVGMQGYVPGLLVCQVRLALVHRGLDEAGSPVHLMHACPTVVGTRPHSDGKPTRQRDGPRTMLSTCQAHHPPLHRYSTVSSASTQSANSLTFYRRAQPRSPSMSLSQGFSIKRKLPTMPTYHYQISRVLISGKGYAPQSTCLGTRCRYCPIAWLLKRRFSRCRAQ